MGGLSLPLFSEPEARTKLCPLNAAVFCMAYSCMAWTWAEGPEEVKYQPIKPAADGSTDDPNRPPGDGWVLIDQDDGEGTAIWSRPRGIARLGYCAAIFKDQT